MAWSSRPNRVVSVPNGTTANAANAAVVETRGASTNRIVSAAFGFNCSFRRSLNTSANGCSTPSKPTRLGPLRSWMYAQTLRSIHTMNAADNTSMLKTTKIRPSCAMTVGGGSQLISVRPHRHPRRAPVGRNGAAALAHVRLELGAEVLHGSQRPRRGGVSERAQRRAGDVRAETHEEIDEAHLPFDAVDAGQDL